jgi:hypothetical protein
VSEQTPQIPVSTYDYTVYGDCRAEWEEYPHGANEFVRGDYVRTEDADAAYAALSARCMALEQAVRALIEDIPAIGTFYGITERLTALLPGKNDGQA